jgi:NADPH2:quinone reductase
VRAIVATGVGGPQVLELQEVPDPEPGPGELLVAVEAAGVNYRDVYEREGQQGREPPYVAGVEGSGRVVATGELVCWNDEPGSYAERVLVRAERAVPVPDGVSAELACAALLQGLTAHYLATDTYAVQPGDDVLVHAAAGGVGLLLTQVVKLRGGRVIATTSSEEKAALAREAGADEVIGYDGFAERVRELTDGEGVAVVYDGVGCATFDGSLDALRRRGMLVLYGNASGVVPPVDPARLRRGGSLYLTRPTLHDYVHSPDELRARAGEVLGWVADGRLQVRIGATYPLGDARKAHQDLEARRTTGKLLLDPRA